LTNPVAEERGSNSSISGNNFGEQKIFTVPNNIISDGDDGASHEQFSMD
jgi:hypothetical protein